MRQAWVFDLDDTLYLERDYVRSGFHTVDAWATRELGVSGLFDAAWSLFLRGVRGTSLTDAFDAIGRPLTRGEIETVVSLYRGHRPSVQLCADARELLSSLPAAVQVGIVTDGPARSQRAKLRALGLDQHDYAVEVTDERGPSWHKPNASAFRYIQSVLGVEPDRCTYVADNPIKDFAGPKLLGWRTVRIIRRLGLHALVESNPGEVDLTLRTLNVLAQELEGR